MTQPAGVQRRNAHLECGILVGVLNILITGQDGFQTVAFHCSKPARHRDECEFVGNDLVVKKKRR